MSTDNPDKHVSGDPPASEVPADERWQRMDRGVCPQCIYPWRKIDWVPHEEGYVSIKVCTNCKWEEELSVRLNMSVQRLR